MEGLFKKLVATILMLAVAGCVSSSFEEEGDLSASEPTSQEESTETADTSDDFSDEFSDDQASESSTSEVAQSEEGFEGFEEFGSEESSTGDQSFDDEFAASEGEDSFSEFSEEQEFAMEDEFQDPPQEELPLADNTQNTEEAPMDQAALDTAPVETLTQEESVTETADIPPPELDTADPAAPAVGEDLFAQEEAPMETPLDAPGDIPPPDVAADMSPMDTVPGETPAGNLVNITNIQYRANESGGTIIIEGDAPLTYTTRSNPDFRQFVIEVPNAKLPKRLQRPLNTKDIAGSFGSIDAYQNKGSTTARIVVQLREGISEPVVQAEGFALVVVSGATQVAEAEAPVAEGSGIEEYTEDQQGMQILSSKSLEDFLAGNNQFYGKKINIETNEMDVREVFKLISEESGVNLVLADEVRGNISLKLREVPWDQALVVVMKAKKLGYTRSGNVLRIAPIADIQAEEDKAYALAQAKKVAEPLVVRMVPISYAKVEDLVTQVKSFMTDKGKVVGDTRTSSLVLSETADNMDKVLSLIKSIDVPPPQVLIEGKVVEATEQFQRAIGVNWNLVGRPGSIRGARAVGNLAIQPGGLGSSSLGLSFNIGTLDGLGDLSAQLALFEREDAAKVLSSPRIVTLHNETAQINQSAEIPLISSTTADGATTKNVSFKPVKLSLAVTPQITNDGAVIMSVDVSREFVGAVVEETTQARPVNSRNAKTKVLVKNGQTAVIGGIYQNDSTQNETKVPLLGDIPIFGWLFKTKSRDNTKNELLIFLTPRILAQLGAGGSSLSDGLGETGLGGGGGADLLPPPADSSSGGLENEFSDEFSDEFTDDLGGESF